MHLEELAPAAQQVHLLIAAGMKIDRAAVEVVIAVDRAAVLHPADTQHALVQVALCRGK